MDETILRLMDNPGIVPAAPEVVTRLVNLTNDPNCELGDVAAVLRADPAIVADLMLMANSAAFGATQRARDLAGAVLRLGLLGIRTLVLGRSMVGGLAKSPTPWIDADYFWRRSLATGVLAAQLARRAAAPERELAFMAGLLCDIGVIILARALPQRYEAMAKSYAPGGAAVSAAEESKAVGVTHAQISASALERWGFPASVVAAVRHHQDEPPMLDASQLGGGIAPVLNGAGQIARILCETRIDPRMGEACAAAMKTAGVPVASLPEVLEQVEGDFAEVVSILRVEIIPSKSYDMIVQHVVSQVAAHACQVAEG